VPTAVLVRLTPDRGGGWVSGGTAWDLDLRRADGSLAATAHAAHVASRDYFDALPMSVSATRVYFLDGATTVRWLMADGGAGVATTLPPSDHTQAVVFAVSADDTRIAVATFSSPAENTVHEKLVVRRIDGGAERTLADFTAHTTPPVGELDRPLLRPLGWHGDTLVVRAGSTAQNSPSGYVDSSAPIALIDTAIGASRPSPCDKSDDFAHAQAAGIACNGVLHGWDGSRRTLPSQDNLWVSPDAQRVAGETQDGHVGFAGMAASDLVASGDRGFITGWIDASHLAVQDLQTGNGETPRGSRILTVSASGAHSGGVIPGYAMDTVPALLR
jgi:hypothetical protein